MTTGQGLELKISAKELEKLTQALEKLEGKTKLSDISFRTRLGTKFSEVLAKDVRKRFMSSPPTTSGGQVYGDAYWRALSDSYLRSRPDRIGGQVLIDTTQLMQSFSVGSPMMISEFENQFSYKYGSRIKYAERLQKTWPIVFFHQRLLDELGDVYLKWLIETLE